VTKIGQNDSLMKNYAGKFFVKVVRSVTIRTFSALVVDSIVKIIFYVIVLRKLTSRNCGKLLNA